MPRPKSENPRDVRLVVKLTAGERGRMDELAKAAGLSVSDYVRGRALEVRPAAGLLARTAARSTDEVVAAASGRVVPLVDPPLPRLHRCPKFAGCGFQAPSVKARCPIHGCTVKS